MSELFVLHYSIAQYCEFAFRIIFACVCGAIVGYEREKKYKDAGLRTHLIVCCSAALMMIVSKYGFADLGDGSLLGTKAADPARIAAQVISGVSFIGAGVIFHNKNSTKGLTTASGLWAIAGVGIAIGSGMYGIGFFASVVLAVIQTLLTKISTSRISTITIAKFVVEANNTPEIRKMMKEFTSREGISVREESIRIEEDNRIIYDLTLKMQDNPTVDKLNSAFESNEDIKSISFSVLS